MQTVEVRFEPSPSGGVIGYNLAVATAPGAYASAAQIDIPVGAARVQPGGVLAYDVQMTANAPHYLAMRAYSSQSFSPFSNEIVVPAVAATATTSTAIPTAAPMAQSGTSGANETGSGSTSGVSFATGSGSTGATTASTANDPNASDPNTAGSAGGAAMSSLDFDGAGEFLASSAAHPLGASTQFSLSLWVLADPTATGARALVLMRGGGGATQNRVGLGSDGTTLTLGVTNDAGQSVYEASWAGALTPGAWQHLALTFDASVDAAPILLVDGVVRAPTSATLSGAAPTFADSAGRVFVGGGDAAGIGTWLGAIGHAAVFGVALGDDEVAEISQRGHALDLREDSGAYQASGALLHYWRLGEDPNAVGYDSGSASTPIDLDDASGYMDGADIVADAPASL